MGNRSRKVNEKRPKFIKNKISKFKNFKIAKSFLILWGAHWYIVFRFSTVLLEVMSHQSKVTKLSKLPEAITL